MLLRPERISAGAAVGRDGTVMVRPERVWCRSWQAVHPARGACGRRAVLARRACGNAEQFYRLGVQAALPLSIRGYGHNAAIATPACWPVPNHTPSDLPDLRAHLQQRTTAGTLT